MIESLQEHGVDPADLVPALMTTHTVKNPDYDPEAAKQRDIEEAEAAEREAIAHKEAMEEEARKAEEGDVADGTASEIDGVTHDPAPPYAEVDPTTSTPPAGRRPSPSSSTIQSGGRDVSGLISSSGNPFDDTDLGDIASGDDDVPPPPLPKDNTGGDIGGSSGDMGGDIGSSLDGDIGRTSLDAPAGDEATFSPDVNKTPKLSGSATLSPDLSKTPKIVPETTPRGGNARLPGDIQAVEPLKQDTEHMPSLPGVSTTMSAADQEITLDIRWTVVSWTARQ